MRRFIPFISVALVLAIGGFLVLFLSRPVTYEGDVNVGTSHRVVARPSGGAGNLTNSIGEAAAGIAASVVDVPSGDVARSPLETRMFDLTNADRGKNGLPALDFEPGAMGVARARALSQVDQPALSHFDALGELAFLGMLKNTSLDYGLAGENLARARANDPTTLERVQQALMNSPTHRENILDPQFKTLAYGVVTTPAGGVEMAAIFVAPNR